MMYLAKFILCSGLFYLAYLLLFEKERMNQFKRFYLLFSLLLSFSIPLITLESKVEIAPVEAIYNLAPTMPLTTSQVVVSPSNPEQSSFIPYFIVIVYISITLLLLGRFIKNMVSLIIKVKKGKKSSWKGVTLILNPKESAAYSFMNYIFVSQTDYENQHIHEGILQHELAHVKQKHSIDVVLIELLQIFLWFNPFLYFYRRAMQINHEYLADESVIHHHHDVNTYQLILINYISTQNGLTLTSQFNYLTIKKRLTMMSKTNTMRAVLGRQLLLLPILGVALFLFSTKIEAKETVKNLTTQGKTVGLSQVEQKEYIALVDKYFGPPGNKFKGLTLSKPEIARLEGLYHKMNKDQQKNAKIIFLPYGPIVKKIPSVDQLSLWQNSKKCGIWIDQKRVENSKLSRYKNTDFSYWAQAKLTKKSVNYEKLNDEVYLQSNSDYKAYYDNAIKNPKMAMIIKPTGKSSALKISPILYKKSAG